MFRIARPRMITISAINRVLAASTRLRSTRRNPESPDSLEGVVEHLAHEQVWIGVHR